MEIIVLTVITAAIYFLSGFSFSLVYSIKKQFYISHAILFTFGAYFSYLFVHSFALSIAVSIFIAIVLTILLSFLIELFIYAPLNKKNSSSLSILIASLGLYILLENLISIFWGSGILSIRLGDVKPGIVFLNTSITLIQILIIALASLTFIFSLLLFKYSKFGRQYNAVVSNYYLSITFGISSKKVYYLSLFYSSLIASLLGVLVSLNSNITPTMGFNLLLFGVVAMIIGGVNSTWGLVGGSLLLATAQHIGAYYFDGKWINAIAYIILILFLIWKPLGFSGKQLKKVEV